MGNAAEDEDETAVIGEGANSSARGARARLALLRWM